MKSSPSETVKLRFLMHLAARGGAVSNTAIDMDKSVRETLVEDGLLEVEDRKPKPMLLKVTDAGFRLCSGRMSWPKPKGDVERLIDVLLTRIGLLFASQRPVSSLGDFINASTPPKLAEVEQPAPPKPSRRTKTAKKSKSPKVEPHVVVESNTPAALKHIADKIEQAVRVACLELGGGRHSVRVRLADLRKRIPEFTHSQVTEAVLNLARRNELTLYPFDEPLQTTAEDEAAAINSSTGVAQHILYFGGSHS